MPTHPPRFDPRDPALHQDPYPLYARLREEDPVHRSPFGMWVLSRFDDVQAALRDPRLSSRPSRFSVHARRVGAATPAAQAVRHMVTFLDPPEHTRLRRLLAQVITEHLAEHLREEVRQIARELLQPHAGRGEMDLIADFAAPLPVRVIAGMLGIPPADRDRVKAWSASFFSIFAPLPDEAAHQRLNEAIVAFRAYLGGLVEARRRRPGTDVISALIKARDGGDLLSEDELLTACILLFANGEETLVHLIGNGVHALLRHRPQWERLREEPQRLRAAVEELQRFDTPSQAVGRSCSEPVTLQGRTLPAGAPVYLLIGAAHRDPRRHAEPDRLDIGRADGEAPGHLGFGSGRHACLGAGIARVEVQEALAALLQAAPRLALATDAAQLRWRPDVFVRGLQALPVRF
jgi:cytochrome P450